MAKLKICDNNGNLYPNGYINVVDQLINSQTGGSFQNFQDFIDAEPDERADILQQLVKIGLPPPTGVVFTVTQQKLGATPPQVAIDSTNCRIIAQNDTRVRDKKKRTRITIPFPDAQVSSFAYLESYLMAIIGLYMEPLGTNPQTYRITMDATKKENAFKFMFGAMMLTRCR